MNIPRITTEQMILVDRLMIEKYGITLIQMMENAGRCLAITARDYFLGGECKGKKVVVLAGTGGNGGGAMVCARRLANWGSEVKVYVTDPNKLTPVPAHQFHILQQMGVETPPVEFLLSKNTSSNPDLIIDGIIGYSLKGHPRGNAREMIFWANMGKAAVLSLDTPSGLSLTDGIAYKPVVRASATLTLALPKAGLFEDTAKSLRGSLFLADISVPPQLYAEPGLDLKVGPIFSASDILKLGG